MMVGYRLGIDWRKVEPTEIHYRIWTNYRPEFDQFESARVGLRAGRESAVSAAFRGEPRELLTNLPQFLVKSEKNCIFATLLTKVRKLQGDKEVQEVIASRGTLGS